MPATFDTADHRLVSEAVAAAERITAAEIVTIVARRSDRYADIAWAGAAAVALGALAVATAWPALLEAAIATLRGGWIDIEHHHALLLPLLALVIAKFVIARLLLAWLPLRLLLTPGAVKRARVRDRAIDLFRVAAQARTGGRTGVLVYLSLAEHRAEIVADQAVTAVIAPAQWGDAMAMLLDGVRDGRAGEGMAAAVSAIGALLASPLPRAEADSNELPDRLIEL